MVKSLKIFLFVIFGIFSLKGPLPAAEEASFRVIVHPSNKVSSMTRDEVSKLFLKKVGKWDGGQPVSPVDLGTESSVREKFSKEIHGKTVIAIKAFWQQKIFTGRDVPPPEKPSDAEVMEYVMETPGAIGYIAAGSPTGKTKVLKITD